jgi:glycosyltransferase involved in cell wall biosynthesis
MAHALDNVLDAADRLRARDDICFLLVGDGARKQSLVERAAEMQLDNVVFHASLPKQRMPDLWSICDVALVHLKDDPVFETVIPSKIFEAFGMAKPVMIVQPRGEAVSIVEAHQAGGWVAPGDPAALADELIAWTDDADKMAQMSKAAAEAAAEHSRERLAGEMLDLMKSELSP